MTPLFAASLESLIAFVVIMLLSALGSWLKQRKGQTPDTSEEEHPLRRFVRPETTGSESAPPPARPKPFFDLEGELRRLLGEEPEAPPAPAPPPVLREVPAAPPPIAPRPMLTAEAGEEFVPVPLPVGTHFPKPARELDAEPAPAFDLASMAESASAYRRGSTVDAAAETKLQAARTRTEQHKPLGPRAPQRTISPDTAAVLRLLRQPRTARQAILASVILSPPKGLGEATGGELR